MFIVRKVLGRAKDNEIFKVYGIAVILKLVAVAISFINSVLVNRCLGVALRGEYTTITNVANLIQMFLNLGIGSAYPAFKRKHGERGKRVYVTITYTLMVLYMVIIAFLFPTFSNEYRWIASLAVISAIENLLIFIGIIEDVTEKNKLNILISFAHMLSLLGVLVFFKRNLEVVLTIVIFEHLLFSIFIVLRFRLFKIDIRAIKRTDIVDILKVAIPAMLMNILMYLNYSADVLFLSYMIDDNIAVGLYGTAVTLGNMLWIIPDAFKDIIYNRSAKKDNPKEIICIIVLNFIICTVILLGFFVLGKWFLGTIYGSEYIDAYSLVIILFIGTFPMILYKLIHPIYIANGRTKTVVVLLAIAVVVNIIGNVMLIPDYKAVGAAIASVISYSICGIVFWLKFRKDFPVSIKECFSKLNMLMKRRQ